MKRFSLLVKNLIQDTTPFRPSLVNSSNLVKMSSSIPSDKVATTNESLSASSQSSARSNAPPVSAYERAGVAQPPNTAPLTSASKPLPVVEALQIKVADSRGGSVPAFLHMSPQHDSTHPPSTAAILLSGAGGGVTGPAGIYVSMGTKLAALDATIPTLRMDYRFPARNGPSCKDVLAGMDYLESAFGIRRFVLVGWSFGGAPVFTVGGKDQRVVGCATVASQTAETEGIRQLAPRPVLLLHGTGDSTLSPYCSEKLYGLYGEKGQREIKFFEGDNHALSRNSATAEKMLIDFIVKCADARVTEGEQRLIEQELIQGEDKIDMMKRGGDLRGYERMA